MNIRPATPQDAAAIVGLIRELADFEQLTHLVEVTPDRLAEHLFGRQPYAECLVVDDGSQLAGLQRIVESDLGEDVGDGSEELDADAEISGDPQGQNSPDTSLQ